MRVQQYGKSLAELSGLFGFSRQHYYQQCRRLDHVQAKEAKVLVFVEEQRLDQPQLGTNKLQWLWNKSHPKASIGRDALYDLLRRHNRLIRRRKRYRPKMTNGDGKSIYADLRKDLKVDRPNHLWCSDITYLDIYNDHKHAYLICITDEYSHKVVGYHVGYRMRKEELVMALQQAVMAELPKGASHFTAPLILHSDRGSQYKSQEYIDCTNQYRIQRSMTRAGASHENPVAERINGILKNELIQQQGFDDLTQAQQWVDQAIKIYNEKRPHLSCQMLTPNEAHQKQGPLKKLWRGRKKRPLEVFFSEAPQ